MINKSGDDDEARLDARPHGRRPPCRTGRPRHDRAKWGDQTSAGTYPWMSSPMQISTRIGVLQAIGRPFSAFLNEHVKSVQAGAQSRISLQFTWGVRVHRWNVCELKGGNDAITPL